METEPRIETVRDKSFIGRKVQIDGTHFIDCRFVDCLLAYSGGEPFLFERSPINDSSIEFYGPAHATLRALATAYQSGKVDWVERIFDEIRSGAPLEE